MAWMPRSTTFLICNLTNGDRQPAYLFSLMIEISGMECGDGAFLNLACGAVVCCSYCHCIWFTLQSSTSECTCLHMQDGFSECLTERPRPLPTRKMVEGLWSYSEWLLFCHRALDMRPQMAIKHYHRMEKRLVWLLISFVVFYLLLL